MKLEEIKRRLEVKYADEYRMSREAVRKYSPEELELELEAYSKELRDQFLEPQTWYACVDPGRRWWRGPTSKEIHADECPVSHSELEQRLDLDWEIEIQGNVWCNVIREELARRLPQREDIHTQVGYDS